MTGSRDRISEPETSRSHVAVSGPEPELPSDVREKCTPLPAHSKARCYETHDDNSGQSGEERLNRAGLLKFQAHIGAAIVVDRIAMGVQQGRVPVTQSLVPLLAIAR